MELRSMEELCSVGGWAEELEFRQVARQGVYQLRICPLVQSTQGLAMQPEDHEDKRSLR